MHDRDIFIKESTESNHVLITKSDGFTIGVAFGRTMKSATPGKFVESDSDANATLWAAADKLLTACEDAREAIGFASSDLGHTKGE